MLINLLVFLMLIHGLIHFMGFAKAFGDGNVTQLTQEISKPAGVLWVVTGFLFILLSVLLLLKKKGWPMIAFIAVIVSQALIIGSWKDARFGTIANAIILLVATGGWASQIFESQFRKDVKTNLRQTNSIETNLLTDADIQSLPQPVQKYLRYAGVVNQPKVKNVRIVFKGEMRGKDKDWFKFESVQYNFFNQPARLFYMKAKMFGTTVPGYHEYQNAIASMKVKLFGLFPVMQAKGPLMNTAETVTVFNDMCLMAPSTLIDKRIQWEPIDHRSVKATFTNGGNKISAILYFNHKGELVNFISDDRYDISDMEKYQFSTPVRDYKLINGRNVPTYGETVWHYPGGEFVYGKFYLENIEFNIHVFK